MHYKFVNYVYIFYNRIQALCRHFGSTFRYETSISGVQQVIPEYLPDLLTSLLLLLSGVMDAGANTLPRHGFAHAINPGATVRFIFAAFLLLRKHRLMEAKERRHTLQNNQKLLFVGWSLLLEPSNLGLDHLPNSLT